VRRGFLLALRLARAVRHRTDVKLATNIGRLTVSTRLSYDQTTCVLLLLWTEPRQRARRWRGFSLGRNDEFKYRIKHIGELPPMTMRELGVE
jgi:hypothetical protein